MNFKPSDPTRVLHDTWVFVRAQDIHLFYLAPSIAQPTHRLIGHAISRDWLSWEELPPIELTGATGEWDSGRVGTGWVFEGDDGLYYMAYTGRIDPQEDIGLAVSEDLISWRKTGGAPVWALPNAWPYESRQDAGVDRLAWRDPYVAMGANGLRYAYASARLGTGDLAARACVARCRIDQCRIDQDGGSPGSWTTLDPIAATGQYAVMEVPEVFEHHGRWWLTFTSGGAWGRRLNTAGRERATGTFYLWATAVDGPWHVAGENLLIGSGEGRTAGVCARSVEWGAQRLVYHHYDGPVAAGSPQALGSDGERLWLEAWRGVDGLHLGEVRFGEWEAPKRGPLSGGQWHVEGGRVRGRAGAGGGACVSRSHATGLDWSVTLTVGAGRAGVVVGLDGQNRGGVVVLLDTGRDRITLGRFGVASYGPLLDDIWDVVRGPVGTDRGYALRILLRSGYIEVFVDGELVYSFSAGDAVAGDGVACVVEDGRAEFDLGTAYEVRSMTG